jgi:hypothetical protein
MTVSAAEVVLEPLPAPLKIPVDGAEYQDDAFFAIVDPAIKMLSNKTAPTGSQRMKAFSAYTSLKGMSVSPENYDAANNAFTYLYYAVKAGEAYENFFSQKKSVASMTDGSEFYELAGIYHMTASNWWELIAERYPNASTFKLPEQSEPLPEETSSLGVVLDGLKYPISMAQKQPNPDKPYQDKEVITTIERWIEDNVDTIPNQTDLQGQSQGTYFINGDDLKWAKSTYMGLTTKNVNPDFYDTANYINAFLYYMAQAREYYDQYISERTSLLLISDGEKPYETAKSYYDEAGVALTKFIGDLPAVNNTKQLPEFPRFDEIPRGRQTQQDMLQGDSSSPWGGSSWGGGGSFN